MRICYNNDNHFLNEKINNICNFFNIPSTFSNLILTDILK